MRDEVNAAGVVPVHTWSRVTSALQRMPPARPLLAATAVLVAVQVAWSLTLPPDSIDDGLQLTMALARVHGQVPNVDVYSVYPPLNTYLLYGAFRLFGESVVIYRFVQTLACLVIFGGVWTASRGSSMLRRAILGLVIVLLAARLAGLQSLTALMWSTLAVTAIVRANRSRSGTSKVWSVVAGVAVGLLALTRLNFALYLLSAVALDGCIALVGHGARASVRTVLRDLSWLVLPAAVSIAILLGMWGGSVTSLLYQIVVMTSRSLIDNIIQPVPGFRTLTDLRTILSSGLLAVCLPMGWLAIRCGNAEGQSLGRRMGYAAGATGALAIFVGHWRPLLLPLLCLPCLAAVVYGRIRCSRLGRAEALALMLFTFELHYTLSRPDGPHFLALIPAVALALMFAAPDVSTHTLIRLGLMLGAVFAPQAVYRTWCMVSEVAPRLGVLTQLPALARTRDGLDSGVCNASCLSLYPDRDERAAAAYIRARSADDDAIFSGFTDHRGIFVNDLRAYWICNRRVGTRYAILQEGISTGEAREAEIAQDLSARNVRWLFLVNSGPGQHVLHREVSVLDTFIRQKFSHRESFGPFEVWGRKPTGEPAYEDTGTP